MLPADPPPSDPVLERLGRALDRGRLGHAWLFTGPDLEVLGDAARRLAALVNCAAPPRRGAAGLPAAACGACRHCRRIAADLHPDVLWLRPESKTRIIPIDPVRGLMGALQLKPTEAAVKVGVLAAADRLNAAAANAFLKTLEEPPARSLLLLLSTEPDRLLETILSRCQRLNLGGERRPDAATAAWAECFAAAAATPAKTLLERYRLLDTLLARLVAVREAVEKELAARSPLERHDDVEPELRGQWEDQLAAAIEGEYRRRRAETLAALEWWLRDVWLLALGQPEGLLGLPAAAGHSRAVAARVRPAEAAANLAVVADTQRLLHTNVQEALALEVALLKLRL
jgi:DNA polymerase-3 subunit delta'